ncbi:hypothetical protein [Undibacterium rugosum]|uniref:Uncharacterized protein n=1 Tax=Undibacterium rugosum TaxID=2762291 RepID=A0A923I427_9BURK|nr:hypothetical protein [Undibacterium rugosum]MBC3935980.1 hypothetical protein [Undibacterium rugosum]MBR7778687.1 hypothetical protein [Undibacterium rugosum]
MRTLAFLEALQRLILVAVPAWIIWCSISAVSAPYRPDQFLFMLFLLTVALVYSGCIWTMQAIISEKIWITWRFLLSVFYGLLPFAFILLTGHFLALSTRSWLS